MLRYIFKNVWRKEEKKLKHATRNMEYLIFGLLISPSIYACLIFSRCIHGFFFLFFHTFSPQYTFATFFSRFLLFPAFCTSFSLPPFILATIFCSSTRGRSFILPSSCLLDGRLLILFRYFLKLYLASFVNSNRSILTYTFADSFSHSLYFQASSLPLLLSLLPIFILFLLLYFSPFWFLSRRYITPSISCFNFSPLIWPLVRLLYFFFFFSLIPCFFIFLPILSSLSSCFHHISPVFFIFALLFRPTHPRAWPTFVTNLLRNKFPHPLSILDSRIGAWTSAIWNIGLVEKFWPPVYAPIWALNLLKASFSWKKEKENLHWRNGKLSKFSLE